jgi:hypothetical protein
MHFFNQPPRNLPCVLVRQKFDAVLYGTVMFRHAPAIADDNRVAILKKPVTNSDGALALEFVARVFVENVKTLDGLRVLPFFAVETAYNLGKSRGGAAMKVSGTIEEILENSDKYKEYLLAQEPSFALSLKATRRG